MAQGQEQVTVLLDAIRDGNPQAAQELLPVVYTELRRLAAAKMAWEHPGQTLQPTALVHDAYLRLVSSEHQRWNSRGHFFGAAAEAMRRILVEKARRKQRAKHGGQLERLDVADLEIAAPSPDDKLLLVDEVLDELATEDPREAEVVKLRFYVGLGHAEIGDVLGVSEKTVKRYWSHAKAWLYQRLEQKKRES